jgi:Septum formation
MVADDRSPGPRRKWQAPSATPTWRVVLLASSAGVLVSSLAAAIWAVSPDSHRSGGFADPQRTFNKAHLGDCLDWPPNSPDDVSIVNCSREHRFEVAGWIDNAPGAAATGTSTQQATRQQCEAAVEHYLGSRYDPNGRFTVGMLWTGEAPADQSHLLCGLQWPGPGYQQLAYVGWVGELDASKVWPTGTCLGIAAATHQPSGIPVNCTTPHAMEVTGTVNLADEFSGAPPDDADQRAVLDDACARITDAWLAPVPLSATGMSVTYATIAAPSWTAGSRQVACAIGMRLDNGGWATLSSSAKAGSAGSGNLAVPPDIAATGPSAPQAPTPSQSNTPAQTMTTPASPQTPQSVSPPPAPPGAGGPNDAAEPDNSPAGPAPGPQDNPPAGPEPGPRDNPPPGPEPGPPDNPQPAEPPAVPPSPAEPPAPQTIPPAGSPPDSGQ